MRRRDRWLLAMGCAALAGSAVLLGAVLWLLWQESMATEASRVGGLAASLGERTERLILDSRELLGRFDQLPEPRCSDAHLQALQAAVINRPHIRAIGYWRGTERLCGVGFLQSQALKPARADRIYDSGVVAWWPSAQTEVGGVQLFLMRFGDHDLAIDPRQLLEIGPLQQRQAVLWVEGLRFAAVPWDADLPAPASVAPGLQVDAERQRLISRFSRSGLMPIEVVAVEPLQRFWDRYLPSLAVGAALGLLLAAGWVYGLLRYTRHRLALSTQLRDALAQGRIEARYQPVIDLASGRCVGAEALARWTLDGGEAVPPDTFIVVAEAAGLIHRLTLAMLDAVLRDLAPLLRSRDDLSINLNLAADDLRDPAFAEQLRRRLQAANLPSRALKLEITERALVNSDTARELIRHFRRDGHQIAVDDFGTGYSSLSYLESFELDVLKIDKSFVDAIGTEAATSHVIVHVIEMAKSLGLRTVAEGVHSQAQVDWLRAHGVDYAQGYHYSAALGAAEFTDYLRAEASPTP